MTHVFTAIFRRLSKKGIFKSVALVTKSKRLSYIFINTDRTFYCPCSMYPYILFIKKLLFLKFKKNHGDSVKNFSTREKTKPKCSLFSVYFKTMYQIVDVLFPVIFIEKIQNDQKYLFKLENYLTSMHICVYLNYGDNQKTME